jgi:hypothetical protein
MLRLIAFFTQQLLSCRLFSHNQILLIGRDRALRAHHLN